MDTSVAILCLYFFGVPAESKFIIQEKMTMNSDVIFTVEGVFGYHSYKVKSVFPGNVKISIIWFLPTRTSTPLFLLFFPAKQAFLKN